MDSTITCSFNSSLFEHPNLFAYAHTAASKKTRAMRELFGSPNPNTIFDQSVVTKHEKLFKFASVCAQMFVWVRVWVRVYVLTRFSRDYFYINDFLFTGLACSPMILCLECGTKSIRLLSTHREVRNSCIMTLGECVLLMPHTCMSCPLLCSRMNATERLDSLVALPLNPGQIRLP
jgi:hypothetical protein